jgi:hypothetical protein
LLEELSPNYGSEEEDGELNNEDEGDNQEEDLETPIGEISDISSSVIRKKVTRNVGNTQRRRFR